MAIKGRWSGRGVYRSIRSAHHTIVIARDSLRFLDVDSRIFCTRPIAACCFLGQCAHLRQPALSPLTHTRNHSLDVWMAGWWPMQASSGQTLSVSGPHTHTFLRRHAPVFPRRPGILYC